MPCKAVLPAQETKAEPPPDLTHVTELELPGPGYGPVKEIACGVIETGLLKGVSHSRFKDGPNQNVRLECVGLSIEYLNVCTNVQVSRIPALSGVSCFTYAPVVCNGS